jgi:hypothetical protein
MPSTSKPILFAPPSASCFSCMNWPTECCWNRISYSKVTWKDWIWFLKGLVLPLGVQLSWLCHSHLSERSCPAFTLKMCLSFTISLLSLIFFIVLISMRLHIYLCICLFFDSHCSVCHFIVSESWSVLFIVLSVELTSVPGI